MDIETKNHHQRKRTEVSLKYLQKRKINVYFRVEQTNNEPFSKLFSNNFLSNHLDCEQKFLAVRVTLRCVFSTVVAVAAEKKKTFLRTMCTIYIFHGIFVCVG